MEEKIRITLDDGTVLEGMVLPEKEKGFINIKLDNGYNIGILKERIKKSEIIKKLEKKGEKKKDFINKNNENKANKTNKTNKSNKANKPTLLIIHTGGTIASKVDYETGAVKPSFSPEYILSRVSLLKEFNIQVFVLGNILSENMRFEHYNVIMEKIYKSNVDCVIISHGTDTLHYTGAALHYGMTKYLPVVLVGSQRSSDRPSTDAWQNLEGAALFLLEALKKGINGVFIAMHGDISDGRINILPGYRARKMHTSKRDAFKTINSEEVAIVDLEEKRVILKKVDEYKIKEEKRYTPFKNLKIGILKAHPSMNKEEISCYKDFDALIIEGTGLGHIPIGIDEITDKNKEILEELKKLAKKIPIYISSQCIYGRINLDVYATGRKLKEIGVKGHLSDITTEALFMKVANELSK